MQCVKVSVFFFYIVATERNVEMSAKKCHNIKTRIFVNQISEAVAEMFIKEIRGMSSANFTVKK